MRYDRPIWQLVIDAANSINKETFTASDILHKVHETHPEVPQISIRTYVIAMAPNHPTSIHYAYTRNNHPYFFYLGDGRYKLLKPGDNTTIESPPKPKAAPSNQGKESFLEENERCIIAWSTEHQDELITGRKNFGWNGKNPIEAVEERNQVSSLIVLSRIKNSGGLDMDTINKVMDWGGLRHVNLSNEEAISITRQAFALLDIGDLKAATEKLLSINGVGIASASKLIGLFDQNRLAIYDSRVGTALRSLTKENQRLIKCPPGRSRPGDICTNEKWAEDYEKVIWILEIIRNKLNQLGYPFSIADVEMSLFMMGK